MAQSSIFKKTCFECGDKVDKLYDSKCEACFVAEHPAIVELKPLNIKYCNSCKRLLYQNRYNDKKQLLKDIHNLVKKNLVINKHYTLNELKVENFKIDGPKVNFELNIDCDLK